MRTYIEKLGTEYIEGKKRKRQVSLANRIRRKAFALYVMAGQPTFLLSNARCHP